jgi:spore maturation protein CgeB
VNVLWIISHPDKVTLRECEKYDLVLVASRSHAEWLDSQLEVPVVFLPQATDQRRFQPVASQPGLETEVLFVGNSRGQMREAVDWAIRQELPLTVYGTKWEGRLPTKYLAGEHFPNKDLASLYASAKVVLNDHWPDMKDRGFVSNRVFDALASGAVVVSDPAEGLADLFEDIVPTFSSPEELSDVVKRLLADPEERTQRAARGAELVLGEHTFAHRGETMIELIRPLLEGRAKDMEGGVFESRVLRS